MDCSFRVRFRGSELGLVKMSVDMRKVSSGEKCKKGILCG